MQILKYKEDLKKEIALHKADGKTIGFVPTMGALHEGHISLITTAQQQTDIVVCSIFVNPTQFNNKKDFEKYPITIEKDVELLATNGCSILYLPSVEDIYDTGMQDLQLYNLGFIETVYDGAFRPGHFQGVCNVVERLFKAVVPTKAFFGLKDYQQCMVIKKLVELMQWENQLELVFCQTLREGDGLAMSSRNMRLTAEQRAIAPVINESLRYIKGNITKGKNNKILDTVRNNLKEKGFVIDYIDIADANTLELVQEWDGKQKLVCLVAAFIGEIRLIDNLQLN